MARVLSGLVLVSVLLQYRTTSGALQPVTCTRTYTKVGCYKASSSPLDVQLVNDRDPNSVAHQGHMISWTKWHESLHSLGCRCAEKARHGNFTVFAMQNFGECWSGTGDYTVDGPSDKCYLALTSPPTCDRNDPRECMGAAGVNYVYKLNQLDPCQPNPCKNGGKCSKTGSSFQCACPTTYTGRLCDQDVNECWHGNPCQNGGTCINVQGGYLCKCRPGYLGATCQTDTTGCRTRPCVNGGTCSSDSNGGYTCTCPPGSTGKQCQTACRADVVDLGIILDGSGSVGNVEFMKSKLFLVRLVDHMGVSSAGTHVGLICYSDTAHVFFRLKDRPMYNPTGLKLKFFGLDFPDGETRTDRALKLAGEELFTSDAGNRAGVPDVLVVITDGKTGPGSEPYQEVLKPLKRLGVRIITVGVGSSVNGDELREIAMGQQHNVVHVSDIDNLKPDRLARAIKNAC